jgi:ribonuclease D
METMNNREYFKTIEDEYLKALPVQSFKGAIYLIDHPSKFREAEQALQGVQLLGFDTETKPTFKKGRFHHVALLQLSTDEKAFLFRINKVSLPAFILDILEDATITKVGVALRDDLTGLKKIKPFNPQGFIDLQQFVKQYGIDDNGLKKLVANILGFRISKRFQTSNWEQELLDADQLTYAATDAWVCRQIYATLNNHHPSPA